MKDSQLSEHGRKLLNNTSNLEAARAFLDQASPEDLVLLLAEHSRASDGGQLRAQLGHWRAGMTRELDRILGLV